MNILKIKFVKIIGVSVLAILALSIYLLGWSNFFKINAVTIRTADPSNKTLIITQLNMINQRLEIGEPLARINVRAITQNLQRETWIGKIELKRNWIDGSVDLFVDERIPFFRLEEISWNTIQTETKFLDRDGVIFSLPGNLSKKYEELPLVRLSPGAFEDRKSIFSFFDATSTKFPTLRIILNSLSEFESENLLGVESRKVPIKIFWGENKDIALKIEVIERLLALKSSRKVFEIDIKNPALPILRNR